VFLKYFEIMTEIKLWDGVKSSGGREAFKIKEFIFVIKTLYFKSIVKTTVKHKNIHSIYM
jgi:hypothetical protein